MKIKTNILLICFLLSSLSLNAKDKFTMDEIYNKMCIECHSSDGSGNTEKLTPSMIGQTEDEIRDTLIEIEKDQGHIIMEHNRGEILKKGMIYSADKMAKYMFNRFNEK
ncbi:MAG: cytochrome c [Campylobacterota bacterium]|nr:cytochrome c [Campylobacterota bacterium]